MILDGERVARERVAALKARAASCMKIPALAIVRVGERADSASYVKRKVAFAEAVGVHATVVTLPDTLTESALLAEVERLNADSDVQGIIVQLPLPEGIDDRVIINAIDPHKDVDGLTDHNLRALTVSAPGVVPATPRGILALLQYYEVPIAGARVVVVGRSLLVGKSVALLLLNQDATVTVCHSKTTDLPAVTSEADILVVAMGQPRAIGAAHVRPGQVVIDVGIGKQEEGGLVGDVDFTAVKDTVAAISPVPGGVGPMTVVSLFENLLDAAEATN